MNNAEYQGYEVLQIEASDVFVATDWTYIELPGVIEWEDDAAV